MIQCRKRVSQLVVPRVDFKTLPLYLRASCEGFLFDGRERMFCDAWDMECMMILPLLGALEFAWLKVRLTYWVTTWSKIVAPALCVSRPLECQQSLSAKLIIFGHSKRISWVPCSKECIPFSESSSLLCGACSMHVHRQLLFALKRCVHRRSVAQKSFARWSLSYPR